MLISIARTSLQAASTNHTLTANDLFQRAKSNISGITFFCISSEDVEGETKDQGSHFLNAKKVLGTRSHHWFIPVGDISTMNVAHFIR